MADRLRLQARAGRSHLQVGTSRYAEGGTSPPSHVSHVVMWKARLGPRSSDSQARIHSSILTSLLRVIARPPCVPPPPTPPRAGTVVWLSVTTSRLGLEKRSHHRHSHPGGMKLVGCANYPSDILHPIFFHFSLNCLQWASCLCARFRLALGFLLFILRTKLPSDGPPTDNRRRAGVALGLPPPPPLAGGLG